MEKFSSVCLKQLRFFVMLLVFEMLCCKEIEYDFRNLICCQFLFQLGPDFKVLSTKLYQITDDLFPKARIVTFLWI